MSSRKTITLFEHEHTENFNWTEKDLTSLARMNEAVGANVLTPVVRFGKKELKSAEQVGVVRFGSRSVQVLPKIYRPSVNRNKEQIAAEASRNLLKLLSYAGDFPFNESEVNSLLKQTNDWFEILIHLFASRLHEEWRNGAFRNYKSVEGILPILKGKWLISEQLKHPARQTVFNVEYDEFSPDNLLNRTFRFVVEKLFYLTSNAGNKQTLNELRSFMDEVCLPAHLSPSDVNSIILTRINARFAPLLNLAKVFLENNSVQMAHGNTETFSFVFDMNVLFENFMAEFIRRNKTAILGDRFTDCHIYPQARGGTSLFLARSGERDYFRLKPDIVFRLKDKTTPLILDTKYKRLNREQWNLGVAQADFYQMHAYAHRYQSPQVILLYPQTIEMNTPLRKVFHLHNSSTTVKAATVNMQINLSHSSDRQNLIEELKEILGEDTTL